MLAGTPELVFSRPPQRPTPSGVEKPHVQPADSVGTTGCIFLSEWVPSAPRETAIRTTNSTTYQNYTANFISFSSSCNNWHVVISVSSAPKKIISRLEADLLKKESLCPSGVCNEPGDGAAVSDSAEGFQW